MTAALQALAAMGCFAIDWRVSPAAGVVVDVVSVRLGAYAAAVQRRCVLQGEEALDEESPIWEETEEDIADP